MPKLNPQPQNVHGEMHHRVQSEAPSLEAPSAQPPAVDRHACTPDGPDRRQPQLWRVCRQLEGTIPATMIPTGLTATAASTESRAPADMMQSARLFQTVSEEHAAEALPHDAPSIISELMAAAPAAWMPAQVFDAAQTEVLDASSITSQSEQPSMSSRDSNGYPPVQPSAVECQSAGDGGPSEFTNSLPGSSSAAQHTVRRGNEYPFLQVVKGKQPLADDDLSPQRVAAEMWGVRLNRYGGRFSSAV